MKNGICENHEEVRTVMLHRHTAHSMHQVDSGVLERLGLTAKQVEEMLEKINKGVRLVRDADLRLLRMAAADGLQFRFRLFFVDTEPERESVSYPTTWWDAVKDRWLPEWTRRLLPVAYTRVELERYCAYPEIPVPAGYAIGIPVLNRQESEYVDRGLE